MTIGKFGIWSTSLQMTAGLANKVEDLGFGAIWIGSANGDLKFIEDLLEATQRLTVATSIVNISAYPVDQVSTAFHRVAKRYGERILLGVGVGHPEFDHARYANPYHSAAAYLDDLDAAGVPLMQRVLAALGPRMLRLAAVRAAGAHPYLVTAEHTRQARLIMGPNALLAPEQKVVLDSDPGRARSLARETVANPYLGLANYRQSLMRVGFEEQDLVGAGSDRLIDDLVAAGDTATVAARVCAHLDAGADHVAIQLLGDPLADEDELTAQYAVLANALAERRVDGRQQ